MLHQYTSAFALVYFVALAAAQTCPDPPVVSHSTLVNICSKETAISAIGCSFYKLCWNSSLSPPIFSSICGTWRIASSLCSDDAAVVASTDGLCDRLQASYSSADQFRSCLQPYGMKSTSQIRKLHVDACDEMGDPSSMLGCESCTSGSCPNPLVSYSEGCWYMDMGQCSPWQAFCGGEATPGGDVRTKFGFGAAYLCRSTQSRDGISAPPLPPSPPPSPSVALIPPPPSALSPPSATTTPRPPNPTPASCITNSSSPDCVSYTYPLVSIIADITNLCTAMPYMPGCTIGMACQVGQVTGVYCQPLTLLATICADMPGMGGCRSYNALCKNTSVVQQCTQFPAIPGLPTTTQAKSAVAQLCAAQDQAQECATCNLMSCADYLTPLASLCTRLPGADGCAVYIGRGWCSPAAGTSVTSALGRFCPKPSPPPPSPPMAQVPSLPSPTPAGKPPTPAVRKSPPPSPVKRRPPPPRKRSPPPGSARKPPPPSKKKSPPPSHQRRPPPPKKRSPPPSNHRAPPPKKK